MLVKVKGDLFEVEADAIMHQTNCLGKMGKGLAMQVRYRYPNVYTEYVKLCMNRNPLGTAQVIPVANGKYVINVFGQYDYGYGKCYTQYGALKQAFKQINEEFKGKTVAMPAGMGAGLAGGDFGKIIGMVERFMPDVTVLIVSKQV